MDGDSAMPLEYTVDADEGLVRVRATGTIDFDACVTTLRALADDPAFLPHFRVIADFRGVKYTPSLSDMGGFLEAFKVVRKAFQDRTALVVTGWVHLSLARVAASLGRLIAFEMAAFTDPEAALAWVSERRAA